METKEPNKLAWRDIIIECAKVYNTHRSNLLVFVKQNKKNRKNIALLLLTKQILSNLRAVFELSKISYQNDGSIFLKQPIGLLLRNCLSDAITGLYFLSLDDKTTDKALDLLNHDYASAKLFQFEVYRDKIKFANFDDEFAEHMYTLTLEDNFIDHYDLNNQTEEIKPLNERHIWKGSKPSDYIPDGPTVNPQIKSMHDALSSDLDLGSCSDSLYAYYRYFSQWEHFSEYGVGDAMANFGEDNIKFSMVFTHIKTSLDYILKPGLYSPATNH